MATATAIGLAVVGLLGGLAEYNRREAERQKTVADQKTIEANTNASAAVAARNIAIANEARALTGLSQAARFQGRNADAIKLALAAWPRSAADARPMLSRTIEALGQALTGPLGVSPPLRHDGPVYTAAFSPDVARVFTISDTTEQVGFTSTTGSFISGKAKAARMWETSTGVPIGRSLPSQSGATGASFSPDGTRVVIAYANKTAQVWDAATGALIGKPLEHKGRVYSATFSPDGSEVATATGDKAARSWDATNGAPIGEPLRHGFATFSPDGKLVATASGDKTARVWDAATATPLGNPLQHGDPVNSASFSPDDARVVTASADNTARIWVAATGAPVGNPLQHEDAVISATFGADDAQV